MQSSVLTMLHQAGQDYVSGTLIAQRLGVSRAAVWKAIQALQAQGCQIEGHPRRGYRLLELPGILTSQAVSCQLQTKWLGRTLEVLPQVDSTNSALKARAAGGAPHGSVLLARRQTAGRGRLGRSFHSPQDQGLYCSALMRGEQLPCPGDQATIRAAVAVRRTIRDLCGLEGQIKWVNDVMLGGKKVCGILTEAVFELESASYASIVCGIGVNLAQRFPDELDPIACALPGGVPVNRLAAALLNQLERALEQPWPDVLDEYRAACFVLGKEVTVIRGDERYEARAVAIDGQGRLTVALPDGAERTLHSGEVSIRPVKKEVPCDKTN